MPSVKANGIEIAYELRGSGPTLALSHGWTNPTRFWRPAVVEELARHLRVLIYDVRGHGDTTAPDDPDAYSMPIYAQDLRALMDALDIEQAHIGGISQGGMISVLMDKFDLILPTAAGFASMLIRDNAGYSLGPHSDHPRKIATCIIYLPRREQDQGIGTSLYVLKDEKMILPDNGTHWNPEGFLKVATVPYRRNTALIFLKGKNSFHGVEVATCTRDTMQIQAISR